jgi:pyruvate dehydrogenase E1 component
MASWIAAATSYSTNNRIMVPFYIYYSMFGLQRVGDLAWAAGDMQARGFLLGGTSGRTTLNGEGLQHEDGHSHILANTIPNCVSYDPTFAHEVGVIMQHGLKRMVEKQENVFYYITLLNENYAMPGLQPGTEEQIIKGMYLCKPPSSRRPRARKRRPCNCWAAAPSCASRFAAQELLEKEWGVSANVWSCPSFNELARDGQDCDRWNLLHPTETARVLRGAAAGLRTGPVVASTDYMKAYAEQIRAFIPKGRTYKVLGTDGFGRSDFRSKLREHFEVNRHYIVVAALKALSEDGTCRWPRWPKRSRSTASRPTRSTRSTPDPLKRGLATPLRGRAGAARPRGLNNEERLTGGRTRYGSSGSEGPRHRGLR